MTKEQLFDLLEAYLTAARNTVEVQTLEAPGLELHDYHEAKAEIKFHEAIHSLYESMYSLTEENALLRHEVKALIIKHEMVAR